MPISLRITRGRGGGRLVRKAVERRPDWSGIQGLAILDSRGREPMIFFPLFSRSFHPGALGQQGPGLDDCPSRTKMLSHAHLGGIDCHHPPPARGDSSESPALELLSPQRSRNSLSDDDTKLCGGRERGQPYTCVCSVSGRDGPPRPTPERANGPSIPISHDPPAVTRQPRQRENLIVCLYLYFLMRYENDNCRSQAIDRQSPSPFLWLRCPTWLRRLCGTNAEPAAFSANDVCASGPSLRTQDCRGPIAPGRRWRSPSRKMKDAPPETLHFIQGSCLATTSSVRALVSTALFVSVPSAFPNPVQFSVD